jgi:subtilisin family serine protease
VEYARARDVVIVATAGTGTSASAGGASSSGGEAGGASSAPGSPTPTAAVHVALPVYPAAYPGVIGVAGVDEAGLRLADAPAASFVDLVAPGKDVLGAVPSRGHAFFSGSDIATPIVSATAALVRAAYPQLRADDVESRLVATADAVPDAVGTPDARGMVDPYRAVTEVLTGGAARSLPDLPAPSVDAAAQRRAAHWRSLSHAAVTGALIILAAAVTVAGAIVLIRIHDRRMADAAASAAPERPGSEDVDGHRGDDIDDHIEKYFTVPTPPRPENPTQAQR